MSRKRDLNKAYGSWSQSGWDALTEDQKKQYIKEQTFKRATNRAKAYGTIKISPTVVAGYKSGRYGIDTLLNNIEKNNPKAQLDSISVSEYGTWKGKLRDELQSGDFDSMIRLTRANSFYLSEDSAGLATSYKGAMNTALDKVDKNDPNKKALLEAFGRSINFMDWNYSEDNQNLYTIINGVRWEVQFNEGWKQGEYGINSTVLSVKQTKVNI